MRASGVRGGGGRPAAVVVSIGPLASGRATGPGRRRSRLLRRMLCGGASLFVIGQIVLQRHLAHLTDGERAAASGVKDDRSPPPPTPELEYADLDALYPPQSGWADDSWDGPGEPAPWLDSIRRDWLRSLGRSDEEPLPTVPTALHQTWKDAFPPRDLFSPRWPASLQRVNQGWSYRLWTDAENLELIRARPIGTAAPIPSTCARGRSGSCCSVPRWRFGRLCGRRHDARATAPPAAEAVGWPA